MDHLGLVKAVYGLSQCVVTAVADAAHRWFDPSLGKALGLSDGDILASAIIVVDETTAMDRTPRG